MNLTSSPNGSTDPRNEWTRCGARALTAAGGAPPGDPAQRANDVAARIAALTDEAVAIGGADQLTLRAKLSTTEALPRPGMTLRGAGRMMRANDGWLAVHLPRRSDHELVPALTGGAVDTLADPLQYPDAFAQLESWVRSVSMADVLQQAALLGLAISPVRNAAHDRRRIAPAYTVSDSDEFRGASTRPEAPVRVCDLSTLWAGPLAGSLLARSGARVTKLSSIDRPERTLTPDASFSHYLNGAKDHQAISFSDRALLARYLDDADIVITSARPRALSALGADRRPGQIWLRITAFGATGQHAQRVGFGDDAAAAAGAVYWHEGRPNFCADALADPLAGLIGTQAVFELLRYRSGGIIDVNLADAAAWAITTERPSDAL